MICNYVLILGIRQATAPLFEFFSHGLCSMQLPLSRNQIVFCIPSSRRTVKKKTLPPFTEDLFLHVFEDSDAHGHGHLHF